MIRTLVQVCAQEKLFPWKNDQIVWKAIFFLNKTLNESWYLGSGGCLELKLLWEPLPHLSVYSPIWYCSRYALKKNCFLGKIIRTLVCLKSDFFSRIFFRRFSFDYSFAYFLSNILLRVFFRIFFCGFSIVYLARIFFGIFFRAWTFFRIIFTDFLSNLVMRDHIKNQLTVVLSDGTVTQGFIKSNESFNTFVFFF